MTSDNRPVMTPLDTKVRDLQRERRRLEQIIDDAEVWADEWIDVLEVKGGWSVAEAIAALDELKGVLAGNGLGWVSG
jgi:hypothetical protein